MNLAQHASKTAVPRCGVAGTASTSHRGKPTARLQWHFLDRLGDADQILTLKGRTPQGWRTLTC